MPIGAGLSAQLGFGEESAYGTRIAPTRFVDFNSETMKRTQDRIISQGLRAGSRLPLATRQVVNNKGAAGNVVLEFQNKGMGLILKHMLGTIDAGVAAGTTGKKFTAQYGTLAGKSLTVQVGKPSVDGTVRPFDYIGTKVQTWELGCDVDGFLLLTLGLDAKDEDTTQTLASATYASGLEILNFTGAALTLGGSSVDITNVKINGSNGLKLDRYFLRSDTRKKEPIQNALGGLGGSFDKEFEDLTLYNLFKNGGTSALVVTFQGSSYEAGQNYKLVITIPAVAIDGESPSVGGADVLMSSHSFTAFDNGTNPPITAEYTTTDTAP